ncbi:Tol-Pal system subunit TolA [Campylobacter avium LMG 24591]|uniref:Tol-Pal system subunit TolA n=1 Tax=Campylobacter avium LMG 24591 TaxID=522484 RepID=A0A222MYP2_9BACT|nr:TonB C-terminal domain-containing protein [Campylobacter avium]ASQ30969.1 Tol-Pal system subunit TolA [Campylobacter avium LMG 24591]OYD78781.1 Tol-Pal system subunit TolA [Campylobacter avium]HJE66036.1 TonB C-terminal domain-containing protein [Campylobacter avium]
MKDYGLGYVNSFLLALIFYILILSSIFLHFSIYKSNAVKYTDIKDSFVDVDLGSYANKISKTNQNIQEQEITQENQTQGKETTNKEVETQDVKQEASDINSLFGNLKDFQEEKTNKIQSSEKSVKNSTNKPQELSNLFNSLNDNLLKTEDEKVGESSQKQMTGIYDEFRGKVRRILEERWRLYEASGNFAVLVKYYIDSDGKFGYTLVEKSYNEDFDAKVLEFLGNLSGKFIAYPPRNLKFEGSMNLSDKVTVGSV